MRLPAPTSDAVQRRLLDLQTLHRHNPLVQDFIMATEILADEVKHPRLVINAAARPTGEHQPRYTAAGLREVAVLMGDEPAQHDLVLSRRAVDGDAALNVIERSTERAIPCSACCCYHWGRAGGTRISRRCSSPAESGSGASPPYSSTATACRCARARTTASTAAADCCRNSSAWRTPRWMLCVSDT